MIFTLEQISDIHERLGSAKTLAQYAQELNRIGVEHADSFLTDGHTDFFGKNHYVIRSPAAHQPLTISAASNKSGLTHYLELHNSGEIGYLEMSRGLAESGIEKWVIDTNMLTMTFYDKAGNALLVDDIK